MSAPHDHPPRGRVERGDRECGRGSTSGSPSAHASSGCRGRERSGLAIGVSRATRAFRASPTRAPAVGTGAAPGLRSPEPSQAQEGAPSSRSRTRPPPQSERRGARSRRPRFRRSFSVPLARGTRVRDRRYRGLARRCRSRAGSEPCPAGRALPRAPAPLASRDECSVSSGGSKVPDPRARRRIGTALAFIGTREDLSGPSPLRASGRVIRRLSFDRGDHERVPDRVAIDWRTGVASARSLVTTAAIENATKAPGGADRRCRARRPAAARPARRCIGRSVASAIRVAIAAACEAGPITTSWGMAAKARPARVGDPPLVVRAARGRETRDRSGRAFLLVRSDPRCRPIHRRAPTHRLSSCSPPCGTPRPRRRRIARSVARGVPRGG